VIGSSASRRASAAATDTIYLRGLIIDGGATALRGIYLSALRAREG
jgi:hypothetical protein